MIQSAIRCVLIVGALSVTGCKEHLLFEYDEVCRAEWRPVEPTEVNETGFTLEDVNGALAEPSVLAPVWSPDAALEPGGTETTVTWGATGPAEVGEIGEHDTACAPGWTMRTPVSASVTIGGVLAPTDLEGTLYAHSLDDSGLRFDLRGTPVLDPESSDDLLAAAEEFVGSGATVNDWGMYIVGTLDNGQLGVQFNFSRDDGGDGTAALVLGQWSRQ